MTWFVSTTWSVVCKKYKTKLVAILKTLTNYGRMSKHKHKQTPHSRKYFKIVRHPQNPQPNAPLRPIINYKATIGYDTSRWLAGILAPLLGNNRHHHDHVNNSKHLVEELADVLIEEGDIYSVDFLGYPWYTCPIMLFVCLYWYFKSAIFSMYLILSYNICAMYVWVPNKFN